MVESASGMIQVRVLTPRPLRVKQVRFSKSINAASSKVVFLGISIDEFAQADAYCEDLKKSLHCSRFALCAIETMKQTTPRNDSPAISEDLADLALLNIKKVCSLVGLSASAVRERVRNGTFPRPDVVDGMRCTRWKAGTVRKWLIEYTSRPATPDLAEAMSSRASAARAKRHPNLSAVTAG